MADTNVISGCSFIPLKYHIMSSKKAILSSTRTGSGKKIFVDAAIKTQKALSKIKNTVGMQEQKKDSNYLFLYW